MPTSRQQICTTASQKLMAATPDLPSIKTLIGLDGFVDDIIAVIDKRQSFERYEPIRTIAEFGRKVLAAAGQSSNYELMVRQQKLGGNGPIMANALAQAGCNVSYIGCLGHPQVHPVFESFGKRATLLSICDPGHTDALEFEDGKLMLGKIAHLDQANWENIKARVGVDRLRQLADEATLIAMTNWTMLPFLTQVWERLQSDVLPHLSRRSRTFFVDLADPEKRTADDLRQALTVVSRFQTSADVILGLNLKESTQVASVLGIDVPADAEPNIERTARAIRERLNIGCVVIHPRKGAAAATRDASATFAGPFVQQPKISTGAGDHFNAGFCLGRILGMTLDESLCVGCATSGYYVRSTESPSATDLATFIAELPPPQA